MPFGHCFWLHHKLVEVARVELASGKVVALPYCVIFTVDGRKCALCLLFFTPHRYRSRHPPKLSGP